MALKNKTKKKHSSLSKRMKISYERKDQGNGGSRVIDWKALDKDVQFFQPTLGKNIINIIPFEVKSKNHPLVKQGQLEIGDQDYCLEIWMHRFIGPSESSVICLKRMYGKACPICEEAERFKKAGKERESGALLAKQRVLYNVEDTRRKPGELQVFDVSYYLFEKELIDEARNENEDGENWLDFSNPETGSLIKFRCSKTTQGGFEFNEFKSFSFVERDDPIEDDLLESAISFDEHLNILNYEEIQAILYGSDDDEEEEDQDDEEDEKPSKKSSKKQDKPNGKYKCPHDYIFGQDVDEYEECEDCDIWAKCTGAKK